MFQNVFWFDRVLRTMLGSTMLVLAVLTTLDPVLCVVGGILLVTGTSGFCPLHAVFGINETAAAAARPRKAEMATKVA